MYRDTHAIANNVITNIDKETSTSIHDMIYTLEQVYRFNVFTEGDLYRISNAFNHWMIRSNNATFAYPTEDQAPDQLPPGVFTVELDNDPINGYYLTLKYINRLGNLKMGTYIETVGLDAKVRDLIEMGYIEFKRELS